MRARLLSAAAALLVLSCPSIGAAQIQESAPNQQQAQEQQQTQIQQQLQQAGKALQQRDEQGAQQALERADQALQQMKQQAQGQQQSMLDQIQRQIEQARQALARQDQQGAQEAVAQAQRSSEQQMMEQQAAETTAVVRAVEQEPAAGTERQQPFDEIIGRTARTPEGENLGEIGDLIVSEEGEIEAAVIDVGGFLGIGERQIAVDWSKVEMSPENHQIVVNVTREELEAAPAYETLQ